MILLTSFFNFLDFEKANIFLPVLLFFNKITVRDKIRIQEQTPQTLYTVKKKAPIG